MTELFVVDVLDCVEACIDQLLQPQTFRVFCQVDLACLTTLRLSL